MELEKIIAEYPPVAFRGSREKCTLLNWMAAKVGGRPRRGVGTKSGVVPLPVSKGVRRPIMAHHIGDFQSLQTYPNRVYISLLFYLDGLGDVVLGLGKFRVRVFHHLHDV